MSIILDFTFDRIITLNYLIGNEIIRKEYYICMEI